MARLLFRLRQVPPDEAEEVRALLREAGIRTYETTAGSWGLGMPGIWLCDDAQWPKARALLTEYQQQRQRKARRQAVPSHWQYWQRHPWRSLAFLLLSLSVLALSLLPFLHGIG